MFKHGKYVFVFNELLSDIDIIQILKQYNNSYETNFNRKRYRKCDKRVIFDPEIATKVWDKLKTYVNKLTVVEGTKKWIPYCCSDRIKLVRYNPGDSFSWHVDASTLIDKNTKVTFSVTIYLNSVPQKYNGATEFKPNTRIAPIQPKKGIGLLLNTLYGPEHCGQELKGGQKYILRLDVLSKCN